MLIRQSVRGFAIKRHDFPLGGLHVGFRWAGATLFFNKNY